MYFYTNVLNFGPNADNLCNDPTNTFNWVKGPGDEGYFKTALALLTVYFYGNNFNIADAGYYMEFINLSGFNPFQVTYNIQNPLANTTALIFGQVVPPVVQHYSLVDNNICDGFLGQCTFANLTFNQWLTGDVLNQPPAWLKPPTADNFSYVKYFAGFTVNKYPIEPAFYGSRSTNTFPVAVTTANVYDAWGYVGFFNPKIWGDMMLQIADVNVPFEANYQSPNTVLYQKYVALNFGLGGLFTMRCPSELINGYTDPIMDYY